MKKVFLCAILASLSYPAIASSLQDQLSAVAEAEQQGKNEEQRQHDEWVAERNREIQQEKQRRANAQAAANKRAATAAANKKARQDKLDAEASADKKRDQSYWICPYISRHLLSLNPLLACCRRYSRGER